MSTCESSPGLVSPARLPFGVAVLGGPTTVLDVLGRRIVCDPAFDPPTDYGYLQKTSGPAVGLDAVGAVDVVLVSHDLHPDNLDVSGRSYALSSGSVLAPPSAARRLGGPAGGLDAWSTWTSPDGVLSVTAVPARHGPADGEVDEDGFVNCEVSGFVVTAAGAPTVYISGDNASLEIVLEIRERLGSPDVAVLFAGAASVPTKFRGRPLTLTADRAAAAAEILGSPHVVVAHQEGWAHFRDDASATYRAFDEVGIAGRLCQAPLGTWCSAAL
ncbi:MBL fold metallo-hydrolase [Pimelobacter simplex]|uniref:MBL fold metallo-hydrolase n=1 Tax=Nocardioides simplex TaxID=2045 RepID=A0A7J5DTH0_NOCSI|nr:MBL fold metallo-hydrolase [Pimelobacter simplex]KAB2808361.1 MBL fold metallo-hydrolase [Pimelobacter simplex]